MSLINKMLQDLDARAGQPGAAPLPADVRLAPPREARAPWLRGALAGGALIAVAAAGLIGWRAMGEPPAPQVAAVAAPAQPVALALPVAAPVPVVDVAPPPPPPEPEPEPEPELEPEPAPAPSAPRKDAARGGARVAPAPRPPTASAAVGGHSETAAQRTENAYRRALLALEDGRVTEAVATLQAALTIDPRHEPSRQTLVGLLIEAGRPEEAMRQLHAALALDARQPSLAMLLARLQLERGGPALDTLMRTLPHAAGNGEYHAFLAGVLQREGRHREAAGHYQAALRTAPGNGVWWMGLGISLQAEKRDAEAVAAFRQALASGTLAPAELTAFVERRLGQLER
ncbi:MSHA biogenesis protein MshN [Massilia sp. UYP11]